MSDKNEDWLDQMLKMPADYIEDNGFAEGVLSALPNSKKNKVWLEPFLLLGSVLVALVLAFVFLPGMEIVLRELRAWLSTESWLTLTAGTLVVSISAAALAWLIGDVESY